MKLLNYVVWMIFVGFVLLVFPAGVFAQSATLSLDPSIGTFNRGCNFSLNVNLDTGGAQTDGTDAILIYDASRFSATSITNGTIYPDYPGNNIDAQSGKITISGLASVNTPFSGKGTVATINFTVQSNAPTDISQIKFDFNPQDKANTRDSNVVERGTLVDVLNAVVNGNYTVGTGSCGVSVNPGSGGPVVATPSAAPLPTKAPINLPPAGSEQLTFTLAIFGGILTVLGILGLALL